MIIYLYVKQHSKTGLKYFGMTQRDPFSYPGSGKYWQNHLKSHGKTIKTLEVWGFDNQTLCTEFALNFSKENNIVESNEWANLQDENGLSGRNYGFKHKEQSKVKMRGSKSKEHALKISMSKAGKSFTKEHKNNISEKTKAANLKWITNGINSKCMKNPIAIEFLNHNPDWFWGRTVVRL
jgi:hypothetical protein